MINRAHRGRLALGAALTAAGLTLPAALPAQGAATPTWRVVSRLHYGAANSYSGLLAVVAPARKNAWAFGGTDLSGATAGAPLAEHWNGTAWKRATLPSGLTNEIAAVSAPGSADIWAVSSLGGYVLHWNGTKWAVAKAFAETPLPQELTGVTAFGPANVWVFGAPGANPGAGTWHLHGTTWTKVTGLAGGITTASALSPASMWAITAGSAPQDTIAHYNGTSWHKVTSPALSGLQFNGILARSASDIWLSAMNGTKPTLVHFNGHQWQRAAVPFTLSIGSLAADGQGGLWIAGDQVSTNHSYALHRTAAGAWSRTLLSTQALVGGFALIPGTTSAWAAGATPQGTGGDATIWAHGPAA